MRILVYGAGAVGSYLGGSLLQHGHEVTLVVRPAAGEILSLGGLEVVQPAGAFRVFPQVVTEIGQAFLDRLSYNVVLLAMKSYDLEPAIDPLLEACPELPALITLQNGIGLEEQVMARVPAGRVVAGSLTTPIRRDTLGRVVVERAGRGLALAPTEAGQQIGKWTQLFAAAGIPTQQVSDFQAMKWSKALLNMIGNATAAILGRHPSAIYRYRPTFDLEVDMLQETLRVMRQLHLKVIDLPGAPARKLSFALRFLPRVLLQRVLSGVVAGGRGNKMPSFYLDLQAGCKQNEVRYHNAAVARAGCDLDIPVPVNAMLGNTLMDIVARRTDWAEFREDPARLLAEAERYRTQKG